MLAVRLVNLKLNPRSFGTARLVARTNVTRGEELFSVPLTSFLYSSSPHLSSLTREAVSIFRLNIVSFIFLLIVSDQATVSLSRID